MINKDARKSLARKNGKENPIWSWNVSSEAQNLLSENCDNMESGNKYDEDSTMKPLISEDEMDAMSPGNESDAEPMSTNMLEYIRGGSSYHLGINSRGSRYKIHDCIK